MFKQETSMTYAFRRGGRGGKELSPCGISRQPVKKEQHTTVASL
jgi:hypothetical protein